MSGDLERIYDVKLNGPDSRPREGYESFLRKANEAIELPAGKISKDMLTDIAQENVGLAFNRITQIASTGDDKIALQAAREVLDRAYGKVSGDAVQVNIQQNFTSTQDQEILARYYERMKDAKLQD